MSPLFIYVLSFLFNPLFLNVMYVFAYRFMYLIIDSLCFLYLLLSLVCLFYFFLYGFPSVFSSFYCGLNA